MKLVVASSSKSFFISDEDVVTRVEALQALHIVNHNMSVFSASEDNARFKKLLFPDSKIAKSYKQALAKLANVQCGIAPHL